MKLTRSVVGWLLIVAFTAAGISAVVTEATDSKGMIEHNRRIVREGLALCERSGCATKGGCGYFAYQEPELDSGPEVIYVKSGCEERWLIEERAAERKRKDEEIRRKYGP